MDHKTDITKLCRTIKGVDGRAKRTAENEAISFNGISFSSSNQLAAKFNKQFNTSKLGRHSSSRETRSVTRETKRKPMEMAETFTADIVTRTIKSCRNSKAFGPDKLIIFHWKNLGPRAPKRIMKETLFNRHRSAVEPLMIAKDRKTTLQAIHTMAVNQVVTSLGRNVVLDNRPPAINISEKELTRKERTTLAQLRSGHCRLLGSYKSRISKDLSLDVCADRGKTPHDVKHLFNCPAHPTTMTPS